MLEYTGPVYNIEVEEDHTYLVHGAAVHNCQNWLTSQALRDPRGGGAPAGVTAGRARARWRARARRAHRHLHLQRAAHHQRVGGGGLPRGARGRPRLLLRLERQRHARGARLHPALGLALQGGPQELPRPALSRAGRHAGARAVDDPRAARAGLLGGDRDPASSPASTTPRRSSRDIARFLVSVSPRHPVARDRVPQGLQDDGPGRHERRARCCARRRSGAREGLHFVYAGNIPGAVGGWENTRCPACRDVLIERRGFRVLQNRIPDGVCPACAASVPGFWEPAARSLRDP